MKMLASCREQNNNRKSHVDQNDKLNMSLLKLVSHTEFNFANHALF